MGLEHTDTLQGEFILNVYTINTYMIYVKKIEKGISR
jgi:hypothetical protein